VVSAAVFIHKSQQSDRVGLSIFRHGSIGWPGFPHMALNRARLPISPPGARLLYANALRISKTPCGGF